MSQGYLARIAALEDALRQKDSLTKHNGKYTSLNNHSSGFADTDY
jgi:hypothetical protein